MRTWNQIIRLISLLLIAFPLVISCNDKKGETNLEKEHSELKENLNDSIYGYHIDSVQCIKETIKQNQSLSDILAPYRISYKTIHEIAMASKTVYDVKKLATKKQYEIICSKDSIPCSVFSTMKPSHHLC